MRNRGFIAVLAAVAFVALLGYGLVAKNGDTLEVGQPVPDAPVEQLGGGRDVSLADYRGQWVLLNLWASWCEPCRDESPTLESYSRAHRKQVVVVGIDSDDATRDALDFAHEYGITYDLLHDGEGERKKALGATGFPETYLVDPDGNLAAHQIGPVDQKYLDSVVTPMISGGGTGT